MNTYLFTKRGIENPFLTKPISQACGTTEDPTEAHIFSKYISTEIEIEKNELELQKTYKAYCRIQHIKLDALNSSWIAQETTQRREKQYETGRKRTGNQTPRRCGGLG